MIDSLLAVWRLETRHVITKTMACVIRYAKGMMNVTGLVELRSRSAYCANEDTSEATIFDVIQNRIYSKSHI